MLAKTAISDSFIVMIEGLDEDTVLCGPDRDSHDVIIDDIMASEFDGALQDFCSDANIKSREDLQSHIQDTLSKQDPIAVVQGGAECIIVPAKSLDDWDWGVLALARDKSDSYRITGLFTGPTLCVDPDMRGLGKALVVSRFIRDGELPTWHHDEPGYSNAGASVIQKSLQSIKDIIAELKGGEVNPPSMTAAKFNISIEELSPCP